MVFEDSRYANAEIFMADGGQKALTMRGRIFFEDQDGIIGHPIEAGDTLWNLAERYWAGLFAEPAEFWWIIADFQPTPILDPTLQLVPGEVIFIPPGDVAQQAKAGYTSMPLSEL